MKKLSAVETLNVIIENLLYYLEDFNKAGFSDNEQFIMGERTAYVECLEIVQRWEHARTSGLDFDIEAKFPL